MPTDMNWRPGGLELEGMDEWFGDIGQQHRRIVIQICFNHRARNERFRFAFEPDRRTTIRALAVRTICFGGSCSGHFMVLMLVLSMLTRVSRHHRRRRAGTHKIDEDKRQSAQEMEGFMFHRHNSDPIPP